MMKETERKVIVNAFLIDGTGGKPLKDAAVVIEGERIKAVGSMQEIQIPQEALQIDAKGHTVMPGLMDMHVHLGAPDPKPPYPRLHEILRTPPTLLLMYAVKNAREMLRSGFTTVRDMGCWGYDGPSLKKAIELGLVTGCRFISAGSYSVCMTGGHLDLEKPHFWRRESSECSDGVDQVRRRVREIVREGADIVKIFASGGLAGGSGEWWRRNYTLEEIASAVDEAHALGRKLAAHAQSALAIANCIKAGVDTIEHGACLLDVEDKLIEMMVEKGLFLVPTLGIILKGLKDGYRTEEWKKKAKSLSQKHVESFKKAHVMGVKIATGTDSYTCGESAYELQAMVECGMSEMDAIVASTKTGAQVVGLDDQIGTVEGGKLADLLIVEGNPLEDITILQQNHRIGMVMRNGDIVGGNRLRGFGVDP
jgi:imidazolonepropionase-like amidohydrolase